MSQFDITTLTYTPLFCEENIWKLVELFYTNKQANPIDVLFIINATHSVALFEQKKSLGNTPVIWDYHVILCAQLGTQTVIFDFDSRSDLPVTIEEYFTNTFADYDLLDTHYQPLIRSIQAEYFFKHFSSDRSHMHGLIAQSEFPVYAPIKASNEVTPVLTLQQCIDIQTSIEHSQLQSPEEYLQKMQQTEISLAHRKND